MKKENKYFANLNEEKTVEMLPNLFRTTLTWRKQGDGSLFDNPRLLFEIKRDK